jgi:hypothetical protein
MKEVFYAAISGDKSRVYDAPYPLDIGIIKVALTTKEVYHETG